MLGWVCRQTYSHRMPVRFCKALATAKAFVISAETKDTKGDVAAVRIAAHAGIVCAQLRVDVFLGESSIIDQLCETRHR